MFLNMYDVFGYALCLHHHIKWHLTFGYHINIYYGVFIFCQHFRYFVVTTVHIVSDQWSPSVFWCRGDHYWSKNIVSPNSLPNNFRENRLSMRKWGNGHKPVWVGAILSRNKVCLRADGGHDRSHMVLSTATGMLLLKSCLCLYFDNTCLFVHFSLFLCWFW